MNKKIKEKEDKVLYDMIEFFFLYGFSECQNNPNLNFHKIDETNYLLFRNLSGTLDLVHAVYRFGETPCTSDPIWEKKIKYSFNPNNEEHRFILKIKYQLLDKNSTKQHHIRSNNTHVLGIKDALKK